MGRISPVYFSQSMRLLLFCLGLAHLIPLSCNALVFFPKSYHRPYIEKGDDTPSPPNGQERAKSLEETTFEVYVVMPRHLPSAGRGERIVFEPPVRAGSATPQELHCVIASVREHAGGSSRTMSGFLTSLEEPEGDCLMTCGVLSTGAVSCIGNFRPDYLSHSQYELRPIINSTYHIIKEMPYAFYEDDFDEEAPHRPTTRGLRVGGGPAASAQRKLTDTNDIMDVMVVYTPDALASIGSVEAVKLLLNLAIDESNNIFERSHIDLRLRLTYVMGMSNTAYKDALSLNTIIYQATNYGGTYSEFDTEQNLRYDLKADALVILADKASSCGVAWLNGGGSAANQVSVTAYDCAVGYYSFVHEIGHNLGATHDLSVSKHGDGSDYYAHGWCWDRAAATSCDSTCRRSVMAYASCSSATYACTSCARYPYFSNPDVSEAGSATGVTNENDNARTIRSHAAHAAALQDSLQPGGLIFAAAPKVVYSMTSCTEVEIRGWRIGSGTDISAVWLAGVAVDRILSQTTDSVTVVPARSGSAVSGDVVVYQSGVGVNTTLRNAFTYMESGGVAVLLEDFEGVINRFTAAEQLSFYFVDSSCTGTYCITRGSNSSSGVFVTVNVDGTGRSGAFSANFSDSGCSDTVSYIAVDYFAYSSSSHCYASGFLTLQVRYSEGGPWVVVQTATAKQSASSDNWLTLETGSSFVPAVVHGVRVVVSTYSPYLNCDYYNPVSLDNINVTYTSACQACVPPTPSPSAAPTTAAPSISFTPTAAPTSRPTAPPSVRPTPRPSAAPTAAPSGVPSVPPTAVPSAVPTLAPSAAPTEAPTYATETEAAMAGSLTVYGASSSAFDADYEEALAAALESALNNNTGGGASATVTGVEDAARRRLPAAQTVLTAPPAAVRVAYVVRVLLEQLRSDGVSVFGAVDGILTRAAQSSALASDTQARVEAAKGAPVDALTIGDIENDESSVVLTLRKTVAPTVAPTAKDGSSSGDISLSILVGGVVVGFLAIGISCAVCFFMCRGWPGKRTGPA